MMVKLSTLPGNIYQPGFLGGDPHGIVAIDENGVKWIAQPPRSREPIIFVGTYKVKTFL